ncbi:MAG: sigma-70 family RNA polymerase sigma factor [Thermodesulfobacteriota bacterium]
MLKFFKNRDITDEEAMGKFQNGDTKCFDLLLNRHSKGVYRFIYRMVYGNVTVAEDLLQEVFIKVVEHKMNFDRNKKFTSWLYRMSRNHVIDYLRKEKYRNHSSLDKSIDSDRGFNITHLELVISNDVNQEEKLIRQEVKEQIYSKLELLKDEHREVFILREIERLKFDEIAEITDCNINTVKSRHRYAFKELREMLMESGFFDDLKKVGEG